MRQWDNCDVRKPKVPGRTRTNSSDNQAKVVSAGARDRAATQSARAPTSKQVIPVASPEALPRRFRIGQVAEAFGCAPRTVRSWIEKGLLEREKVGNAVFIREDQIEAMVRGLTWKKNK